ncbi:PTS sugar transporter subunit IIA [Mammaliicoccus vitulinus]|uniref:PTS sugar transporter subunit IIA n=1 Tax=Mammaliicoccus vitulinus TaxID=71237 RepID=UPI000E6A13B0|nr:fructose PTS transporter subunit IIA [Mammaliicoccus vitulinus]RIN17526.1 PTS sugar transporter subunit IIA [Mammaliicoccus vitulinus]RIN20569.1 PTS sugar transporter subunit IIA [Mammaliicoccus vitulinus]WQK87952.1 fructose PTS transporter subunit IIA [Mammaliicoccus vitulinus]
MENSSTNVIQKDMILLDKNVNSQDEAINQLIQQADNMNLINDVETFKKSVNDREKMASTAVGYNIAMPHGKSNSVVTPFIGFLQSTKPFRWNENEGELVTLIFLIAVPENDSSNLHLKFISKLSKKLLDNEFRNILSELKSNSEVFKYLNEAIN